MASARTRRIKILSKTEIKQLFGLPDLTFDDRHLFTQLTEAKKARLSRLKRVDSRAFFLLQLGYFKLKRLFFRLERPQIDDDLHYIYEAIYPGHEIVWDLPDRTKFMHQRYILDLYAYRSCDQAIKLQLEALSRELAKICSKPMYLFRELNAWLEARNIVLPGYSFLQDLVGQALDYERDRLEVLLKEELNTAEIQQLRNFLKAEDSLHHLTLFKKEPKDFKPGEIKKERKRLTQIKPIFELSRRILPLAGISRENIKYYASLVYYQSVYKLKRLNEWAAFLYIICFAEVRYQRMTDNLIQAFLYYVRNYRQEALTAAKLDILDLKLFGEKNLIQASKLVNLWIDQTIPDDTAWGNVKKKAYSFIDSTKIAQIVSFMEQSHFDTSEYEWRFIESIHGKVKTNIRPLFEILEIQCKTENLSKVVSYLKNAFRTGTFPKAIDPKGVPKTTITDKFKPYLLDENKVLNLKKFEFFIYLLLQEKAQANEVTFPQSLGFKKLEDELIDEETWKDKDDLIKELNLQTLQEPPEKVLSDLEEQLESKFKQVNQRIWDGANEWVKIKSTSSGKEWTLESPKMEDETNHPFYSGIPQITLAACLHFVNSKTNFNEAFTHLTERYVKKNRDDELIMGCLAAMATNIGMQKMAESSNLSPYEMATTVKNFFRLETLRRANDRVSNSASTLPIFKYYDIEEGVIHSSSDGQKFGTQINTINSRFSPKYFGLKKGIVNVNLEANFIPINATTISPNDHESFHVYDLIKNNTSDIDPDRHSTDSHGSNRINFFILWLFGYHFAPRFKQLSTKAEHLYGFKAIKTYSDYLIKPNHRVKKKLICKEWPNIQKIMVSLGLKTTNQSLLVKKLANTKSNTQTQRALWELDNIIRTLYILDYIDLEKLRQNVQRALNRGEAYHALKRGVFFANRGKFRVKTELEQQIWSECGRLVTNCFIYYNSWILSRTLERLEAEGLVEETNIVKRISPMAWQHINMYGHYDFGTRSGMDMDGLLNIIHDKAAWRNLEIPN